VAKEIVTEVPPTVSELATVNEVASETILMDSLAGIRYIGIADSRSISMIDLQVSGVENPKEDLQWSSSNNFFVHASQINAATRDYLDSLPDFRAE